jgi:AAA domain
LKIDLFDLLTKPAPKPSWLVTDLLTRGSLVALCGVAGAGKSVFSYTLATAIASGLPFLGRDVTKGRVLYFDEENGPADLRPYLYRAWAGHGSPDPRHLAVNLHVENFTLSSRPDAWGATMYDLARAIKPALIIIDTATPACHIEDENDNGEAAAAAAKIRLAQSAAGPDCTTIILKHLRIDAQSGKADMRGAKFWKGTVDAIWYLRRSAGRPRRDGLVNTFLEPEKVRAFGLTNTLVITPRPEGKGIALDSRIHVPKQVSEDEE